ncbi:excalibur calcium-binding domain-containing protein [Streptomyces sp. SID5910]|uniref:excalibur calcium-binding domain-containing protein n=1 Tax=Streptomyces sp. SID5910 TaxID=2690312 RepID=UPI00136BC109|nr:excalibur calcium-binding domain-containing protein [Streptomyces sp. SID5910]MYR40916.1 LPXTG cell wall anchor domain-containing protein [Streptomyces sp. SID5910]MYR45716.1 LPXTG cell wall anchor domain-containing protein [Streptomyces sp. SID5910]
MNLLRKPAAVTVAVLALAALPAVAEAHDGTHPFKNCTEAYDAGYANIKEGDPHYGAHLDRDKDGIGCDNPPAGFVPAGDKDTGAGEESSGTGKEGDQTGNDQAAGKQGTDLAETGGEDSTPYIAAAGGAVVLAGGGLLLAVRRRKDAGAR